MAAGPPSAAGSAVSAGGRVRRVTMSVVECTWERRREACLDGGREAMRVWRRPRDTWTRRERVHVQRRNSQREAGTLGPFI